MAQKLLRLLQTNLAIVLICLLFLVTRLYKISEIPASVYWDEASIGYNAYSVLTTGKDEWGETLPLHFRAFGEFKLPVYIYSVVASEFIFGVNALAVRFPSVIFGLLSIVGLYLVVNKITKLKPIALFSSFMFSITPWFFIFSRTGYESVAGLAFFIWAIYFLVLSFEKNKLLVVSVLLFIASAYSYNSFRILTPIVLGLVFIYKLYKKEFVIVAISSLLLIASALPLYKLYKSDSGLSRLQSVGSSAVVGNYFKNFSPYYLFISGDSNPRSQIPNKSQLYFIDSIFLALGVLYILKSKNPKLYAILFFLFIAPIPAAITKENPHALRSILMSPVLSTISAFGIYSLIKQNKLFLGLVISAYLVFFGNYYLSFVNKYNDLSKSAWQHEYKEIFEKQKEGCVSDEFAQPYIFALFYGVDDKSKKVNPSEFIATRELNSVSDWGFSTVKSFGNYTFPKTCKN
jgi:4-amino-4-deoxy-L-arabinose transferase-like glycosyltransferase